MRLVALLTASLTAITACSYAPEAPPPSSSAQVRGSGHEPYTSTHLIEVAGANVGYLVSYQPVPLHARDEVQRRLPTGTRRIQDLAFDDVGFITPTGEVHRHIRTGEAESLGARPDLLTAVGLFFDERSPVRLLPLANDSIEPID